MRSAPGPHAPRGWRPRRRSARFLRARRRRARRRRVPSWPSGLLAEPRRRSSAPRRSAARRTSAAGRMDERGPSLALSAAGSKTRRRQFFQSSSCHGLPSCARKTSSSSSGRPCRIRSSASSAFSGATMRTERVARVFVLFTSPYERARSTRIVRSPISPQRTVVTRLESIQALRSASWTRKRPRSFEARSSPSQMAR